MSGVEPSRSKQQAPVQVTLLWLFGTLVTVGVLYVVASTIFVRPRISRQAASRAAMASTVSMIRSYNLEAGSFPPSLSALVPFYMEKLPVDAWKRPLLYTFDADGGITLQSVGEDGVPGGLRNNADIWIHLRRATAADRSADGWVRTDDTDSPRR